MTLLNYLDDHEPVSDSADDNGAEDKAIAVWLDDGGAVRDGD